jgi:molybdopterin/thiamine biosynthesis adenylyltransferase
VTSLHSNNNSDAERYSRQTLFPGIGTEGQHRIASAKVAVVGCGATGAAVASLLARAGVGTLRIIDRDYVEFSNLQRQVLFDEADAQESLPKAVAAARKIAGFNSTITVEPHVTDLTPGNAEMLLADADVILDATDNFETRYLINDVAVKHGKPWIYAAAVASYCVTMNVLPGTTACLACIFPAGPKGTFETCDTAGIIGPAVNYVASIEAAECLKMLVGDLGKVRRTLLSYDVWANDGANISAATPRKDCQCCQEREFVHLAGEGRPHITLCGRNSVQIHERERPVQFDEIERRLAPHGSVRHNEMVLKFWPARSEYEMTVFPDGRAIIKGTTDSAVARSLYARFIGS